MRRQPSKADLLIALRQAESERDAWRNVYLNPDPDFKLDIAIPQRDGPDAIEYWFLHAAHRADGGTLRIDNGEYMRVHSLAAIPPSMREAINACPYRRSALVKVEAASAEYARKLKLYTRDINFDHPDLDLRGVGK